MNAVSVDATEVPEDPDAKALYFARVRAAEPREYFEELRARCPVDFEEGAAGVQILIREDIEAVLRDTDLFSNEMGILGSVEPVIPLGVDPPQHSVYRRLLDPLFSRRRMAELQPTVARDTNQMIDRFISAGRVDFSTELAVPLPCLTFLSLLGLPAEELDQLVFWKDVMIRPEIIAGSVEAGAKLQADTALLIYERFGQAMAERRDAPQDDLISFLLTAEVEGGRRLSDSEILRTLFLLLAAGLDTVTISLQCILNYLAERPEVQQMLADDPDTADAVIEELLRWETPVQAGTPRVATRDTELSGCPIAAGTLVVPMFAAANVDSATPESLSVDLRSGDKRHLSFGGGPHRCLGSHLARMELRTVIREWHRRIPRYRLPAGYTAEWNGSSLRGIDHLELEWDLPVASEGLD